MEEIQELIEESNVFSRGRDSKGILFPKKMADETNWTVGTKLIMMAKKDNDKWTITLEPATDYTLEFEGTEFSLNDKNRSQVSVYLDYFQNVAVRYPDFFDYLEETNGPANKDSLVGLLDEVVRSPKTQTVQTSPIIFRGQKKYLFTGLSKPVKWQRMQACDSELKKYLSNKK